MSIHNVSVSYAMSGITATAVQDFISTTGTVTITSGSTTGAIQITTVDNLLYESSETLEVHLSAPVSGTLSDGTGVVTITDNDGEGCGNGITNTGEQCDDGGT